MNLTVKTGTAGKASLVDKLRDDHAGSDIVLNAKMLVTVLRSADKTPEMLKWATDKALPAFLAAEEVLAKLQGLPLGGTALTEAKELQKRSAEAVAALEDPPTKPACRRTRSGPAAVFGPLPERRARGAAPVVRG